MANTLSDNIADIDANVLKNSYYRNIVYTDKKIQLVYMSLHKTEDIPEETHKTSSQFIKIASGEAVVIIENSEHHLKEGQSIIIPAGKKHQIKNICGPLKLYSIYTPPYHPPNVHQRRQQK